MKMFDLVDFAFSKFSSFKFYLYIVVTNKFLSLSLLIKNYRSFPTFIIAIKIHVLVFCVIQTIILPVLGLYVLYVILFIYFKATMASVNTTSNVTSAQLQAYQDQLNEEARLRREQVSLILFNIKNDCQD